MPGYDTISNVRPAERTEDCGLLITYSKKFEPYWEFKGTETTRAVEDITLHVAATLNVEFPNFPLQENPDEMKFDPVSVRMLPR